MQDNQLKTETDIASNSQLSDGWIDIGKNIPPTGQLVIVCERGNPLSVSACRIVKKIEERFEPTIFDWREGLTSNEPYFYNVTHFMFAPKAIR